MDHSTRGLPVDHSVVVAENQLMQPILDPRQRDALRRLGVAGRLRLTASLWDHARAMKVATLRALHPDWDEQAIQRAATEAMQRGSR